jgi:hypothetical protein
MVANNHHLFPLPCWAPALWRVPNLPQNVNEAYAHEAEVSQRGSIAPRSSFMQYPATSVVLKVLGLLGQSRRVVPTRAFP